MIVQCKLRWTWISYSWQLTPTIDEWNKLLYSLRCRSNLKIIAHHLWHINLQMDPWTQLFKRLLCHFLKLSNTAQNSSNAHVWKYIPMPLRLIHQVQWGSSSGRRNTGEIHESFKAFYIQYTIRYDVSKQKIVQRSGLKVLKMNKNTDSHRFPPAVRGRKSRCKNSLLLFRSFKLTSHPLKV